MVCILFCLIKMQMYNKLHQAHQARSTTTRIISISGTPDAARLVGQATRERRSATRPPAGLSTRGLQNRIQTARENQLNESRRTRVCNISLSLTQDT